MRNLSKCLLFVLLMGCPTTVSPIPPLLIGEHRESNSGSESMAETNPTNVLRALVQAAQGGPFECVNAICYAPSGDWYALESCHLNECDVAFNGDVVGALTMRVQGTTWTASGDYAGREFQLLRHGTGAIAVVTWRAAVLRAEAAYAKPVSEACRELELRVSVEYLPQAALRQACGVNVAINGCSFTASERTYIEDVSQNDERLHAHELLHHLLRCEVGDSDHNHRNLAWGRI